MGFPVELHMVHYNSAKYPNITAAQGQPDGLLVIGVFFEIGAENKELKLLTDEVNNNVLNFTADTYNGVFKLQDMLSGINFEKYYLYPGSLTTPPCFESVTWVVMNDKLTLSQAQMNVFRKDYTNSLSHEIAPNYRPVQPLNGRTILNTENLSMSSVLREFSISFVDRFEF